MNQLELLWDYQQTDIQAEAVAKEIKRSPARQKLVKYRDYLLEQQNTIKRIEDEVLTMQDRLAAVQDADVILVMHKGSIVEYGSHEQLMKMNGMYATMYREQEGKGHA